MHIQSPNPLLRKYLHYFNNPSNKIYNKKDAQYFQADLFLTHKNLYTALSNVRYI